MLKFRWNEEHFGLDEPISLGDRYIHPGHYKRMKTNTGEVSWYFKPGASKAYVSVRNRVRLKLEEVYQEQFDE